MKFAHIADCHLGSWREPKMRDVNNRAFQIAIDKCLSEKVSFVLVSGDLFDTAFPSFDSMRLAADAFILSTSFADARAAPQQISLCPPIYLVPLWVTTSMPRSRGFWLIGVANVLSITVRIFFDLANWATFSMSVINSSGLEGVSM